MIKFFRQIRQKLLQENRFSKYLFYAVGEIVLVVIGILIALWINDKNESRLNSQTEKQYYKGFLEDIKLDEALVKEQITITEKRLQSANQLLHELQLDNSKLQNIAQTLAGAISRSNNKLQPTQTTYEDVKSSGNVHLLKDSELKRLLDNYYANTTGTMNYINKNSEKLGERLFASNEMIGTGLFHLAKTQGGFDTTLVNLNQLEELSELSPSNKSWLLNSGVVYVALNSRNLQHFNTIKESITEMKEVLEVKCKSTEE